jgi:hypothetical protein
MRESEIESYLVKRVKEVGGECRKVKWLGRNGAPDRLVMLPRGETAIWNNWNNTIWVELKAEGLAALFPHTPHERQQHREHERMRAVGQRVEVIDSLAGVDALLA